MAHRRVKQHVYSDPDCFKKLSDDIIINHILPLLHLKQRMQSSVLSQRWLNLWRHTLGGNLVFPHGLEAWDKVCHGYQPGRGTYLGCHFKCPHVIDKRDHYIYLVDSALDFFAGPQLDCFSVCYELDSTFSEVVDRWLMCALRLGVKKLHLHLGHLRGRTRDNSYEFPSVDKLSRLLCLDLNAQTPSCTLGISHLKELSLQFVNIPGETVDYLLSSCPLLEFISLKKSACRYLRIVGPSLKLMHLHVLGCSPLKKLYISAPNLITLKYDGPKEVLFFTSITRVQHLGMSGDYFMNFCDELQQRPPFPHFGVYFSHLKSLEFEMPLWQVTASESFPMELPILFKLEEVKVKMHSHSYNVLLWPCCLLKSAPRLRRFVIEQDLLYRGFIDGQHRDKLNRLQLTMQEATKCKHPCLKVIEYFGLRGALCEEKLILHLASCAESLEKLLVANATVHRKYTETECAWCRRRIRRSVPSYVQVVLL